MNSILEQLNLSLTNFKHPLELVNTRKELNQIILTIKSPINFIYYKGIDFIDHPQLTHFDLLTKSNDYYLVDIYFYLGE